MHNNDCQAYEVPFPEEDKEAEEKAKAGIGMVLGYADDDPVQDVFSILKRQNCVNASSIAMVLVFIKEG